MRVTFLGTGTSVGVPMIQCDCAVCRSDDPRNRRRRTSLYVEAGGACILVDTPPDFREQALEYEIKRVDAVLFTHAHADHIFGFDDIRRFNTVQDAVIPAFADSYTISELQRVFNYIGQERIPGHYRPRIDFRSVEWPFDVGGVRVTPFPVRHGVAPAHGFRFDCDGRSLGYAPDCASMSDEIVEQLQGMDLMILDALRHTPHVTHLTVTDSVKLLQRIGARRSLLTHMCHDLDHAATQATLPDGIEMSYDGLALKVGA